MPPCEIVISAAAFDTVRTHAVDAYPQECCGILLGRDLEGVRYIQRAVPTANLADGRTHDRYLVDPRAILAAERDHADNLDIVGFYHSHPDHPAEPSATDEAEAWPVYSYVIASVCKKMLKSLRMFTLEASKFVEQSIKVDKYPTPFPTARG